MHALRETPPPYPEAAEHATDVGTGPSTYTDYDRAITEAWLTDPARQSNPWTAFISLVSPHYSLTCPEDWDALYDPADMDLPIGFHDRPSHLALAHMAYLCDYDAHFDEEKTRKAKAANYGLISFMDHCVGRILAALEASNRAENMVILNVSDHGDMMGDQGFWNKMIMYDQSVGISMILKGLGIPQGYRVQTCTNSSTSP